MTTPVAASLDKVPVGTWAEYQIKRGDEPARKLRHALVGKSGSTYVLESRSESPRGGRVITQTSVTSDPAAEGAVKKVVSQLGDAEPMEMPVRPHAEGPPPGSPPHGRDGRRMGMGRTSARFLKPDPKALLGKETVKLVAGSFAAEHYRQVGPHGGTVDYWLSEDVGPFGLVKLEVDRPGGAEGNAGKVTMELVAKGKGATAEITKPAKPFDPGALRGRWGRGGGEPGASPGGKAEDKR